MKKLLGGIAALLSLGSIADAAVGPRREIAIDCGDIKLSFVVADISKATLRSRCRATATCENYSQNWILRLDIDDKDTTVLTIKNAGESAWGPWMKEGDSIGFSERYFRWQDNKLSWTIKSEEGSVAQTLEGFTFAPGRAHSGFFTIRSTANKGIGTTYKCLLKSNKWEPAREGTP
jgi:hypothetical protein